MRWKTIIAGWILSSAAAVGCTRPIYMSESDHAQRLDLPDRIEVDPKAAFTPDPNALTAEPPTDSKPERPARYLTLQEAIAQALEHGTIGSQNPASPGFPNDGLVQFAGGGVSGSDAIRALSLDPAIVASNIEVSLSKFDAQLISALNFSTTDQPIGSALQTIQSGGSSAIRNQNAEFKTSILKPLPTGGVAGITFDVPYQFTNLAARVNPSYSPTLQFQFEQPLLQGFGTEINQLRTAHPGSILAPFNSGGRGVEGILITRLRFDQERTEFERLVHMQVLNVEAAYWNLYASYYNLYARSVVLNVTLEILRVVEAQAKAGKANAREDVYQQFLGQYEQFRSQRVTALGQVLEDERRLRRLMGIPIEDGKRLVPSDVPTLQRYQPDWNTAVRETLEMRPELVLARQDLKVRQLDLINQKNLLLPDLRSTFSYNINGLGNRLDGADVNSNAFRSLGSDHFDSWAIGLNLNMPLGYREANATVRIARLNLARSYRVLREQEERAVGFLTQEYRNLDEFYTQIGINRAIRQAAERELKVKRSRFELGQEAPDAQNGVAYQNALNNYANALANEYSFTAQFNTAIAGFQFAKGTILQFDNVQIGEGPLPDCCAVRAADHEQERVKAIVLRERANPVPVRTDESGVTLPILSKDEAASIPSLMESAPKATPDLPAAFKVAPTVPAPAKPAKPATVVPASGVGNNLPLTPPGTAKPLVGLESAVEPMKPKVNGPKLSGPDLETPAKGVPGVVIDTGWTPRP